MVHLSVHPPALGAHSATRVVLQRLEDLSVGGGGGRLQHKVQQAFVGPVHPGKRVQPHEDTWHGRREEGRGKGGSEVGDIIYKVKVDSSESRQQ